MRRIRIGLTGLAGVFLLVVLGAAVFSMVNGRDGASRNAAEIASKKQNEDPSEPLAELGVAPGAQDSSSAPPKGK